MVTYVRWHWPDEDLNCYDELDDEGWSTRHIEIHSKDHTVAAAASLAEVIDARDSGGAAAVIAYEHRYGVVPEAAFPATSDEPLLEPISADEFEQLWQQARRARDAEQDPAM